MQDLNDLFYFVQVVDYSGFAPAGRALGVPKSKLSRRITALETRLGVRLINRSTRGISVTELGRAYYQRCVAMLDEAHAAQETIEQTLLEPRGLIRMSCPTGLLYFRIAPLVSQFMQAYPQVTMHVTATSRRVDMVREGFDLALRVRSLPLEDSDLNLRVISQSPQRLVAAPALFERYRRPQAPDELSRLPSLSSARPNNIYSWTLQGRNGERTTVNHTPRLITDDFVTLHRAALDGHGILQLPVLISSRDLLAGNLVDALPGWAPPGDVFHAVFPSRRGLLPAARALLDFLIDRIGDVDFAFDMSGRE